MKNLIPRTILVLALGASSMLMGARAMADEWPLVPGNFWDVTGVKVKDGGGLAYAKFLAAEWRENQEFAKSKGWIKGYMIFANSYARPGEPDMYLVTITEDIPSAARARRGRTSTWPGERRRWCRCSRRAAIARSSAR